MIRIAVKLRKSESLSSKSYRPLEISPNPKGFCEGNLEGETQIHGFSGKIEFFGVKNPEFQSDVEKNLRVL